MPPVRVVPVFKLYGEERGWSTSDLLYCESILQRSSLYEWHIRVHQHAEMVQLLYLHQGRAEIEIKSVTAVMTASCIQVVPALCIHGLHFSSGTQGHVLSLAPPLLSRSENQFGRPLDVLSVSRYVPAGRSRGHIHTLFSALREEYCEEHDAREMMLYSLLGTPLVWLNRQCRPAPPTEGKAGRERSMMRHFSRLIESHYRQHLPPAEYAKLIGLSVTHSNYLCRKFYDCNTLKVLYQRLMLEVRRNLQYARMTVAQLSDYLGFSDAAYFSRSFCRCSEMSPKAFKETIKDNVL